MDSFVLSVVHQIITSSEFAFFNTIDENGLPASRLIEPFEPEKDFSFIIIGTHSSTRKVVELSHNHKSSLSYHDVKKKSYVVLKGESKVIKHPSPFHSKYFKEHWKPFFETQAPESSEYVIIKFTPQTIEISSPIDKILASLWCPVILTRDKETEKFQIQHPEPPK
eukprot:TRINITY_DN1544_c0_g1_i3.p1 TRINITY_DN1544_c0_g1~~TRINITY_DN1544_c0_g1_i3.p1  ORF type:complete len:166 (-),score=20.88 TRINITY_DN1544_c0_g1_i3:127-624(-)